MAQVAAFRIEADENAVASCDGEELYAALRDRGYCVVRIALEPETERTKRLLSWQERFRSAFQQSQSVKEAVGGYRADHGVAVGYRREDQREFFETRLKREVGSIDPSFPDVQDYDQTVVDMFACLSGAATKVLVAVLGAAGLDPKSILDLTDLCEEKGDGVPESASALVPSSSLLRVCSYPTNVGEMSSCEDSSEIAFGAHTDTSLLTVGPISSVAGLEVFDPLARCWLAVEECPEARAGPCELSTVVFVGEFLQVLTRAHFKALIHRVRAPSAIASASSSTRHSCPLIIRGRNAALIDLANTVKYVHQPCGAALLADLDGITMRQLHRLLDIKRQRVVQKPRGPGEPWVLMAYPEMDPTRENTAPVPTPTPTQAPADPSRPSLTVSLVLLVGYTFYSVLKRSFHAAMTPIARDLQLSKAHIGSTASAFAVAYGVSKLLGGAMTDKGRVTAAALFAGGLVLGGACNLLMASALTPSTLMAAWAVNGLVQGASQPALQALVSQLVPSRGRASAWSILLCASNVGYLVSPLVLIPTSETVGWRTAIGGCGVVGVALGLIVWLVLCADRAHGSGGPRGNVADPGTSTGNAIVIAKEQEQEQKGADHRLLPNTLLVSSLLVASGLTLMVLKSLADWTPLYLAEGWGLSAVEAAQLAALSEIGGILGSLLCGPACDLWLGGDALVASAWGVVLCGAACLALRLPREAGAELAFETATGIWTGTGLGLRIGLFLAGFFINFPKTLLPLAMSSTAPKGRAGALAGLLGLAGQVGGTLSGSGAALMIETWGWESFAWALNSCSWLVAAVLWGSRLGKTRDCQRGSSKKED